MGLDANQPLVPVLGPALRLPLVETELGLVDLPSITPSALQDSVAPLQYESRVVLEGNQANDSIGILWNHPSLLC